MFFIIDQKFSSATCLPESGKYFGDRLFNYDLIEMHIKII
jgi:hypothetical protein